MWITTAMSKRSSSKPASKGSVTASNNQNVEIESSAQHKDVPVVAPFGIAYVPPVGQDAVVIPFEGGEACVGVLSPCNNEIQRGELMLFSAGGASIVLKNDGSVLINGKKAEF